MSKAKKFEVTLHTGLTIKIPGPKNEKRPEALLTLSWILRCFEGAIEEAYRKDAPRLREAYSINCQINGCVLKYSTKAEWQEYIKGFSRESIPAYTFDEDK